MKIQIEDYFGNDYVTINYHNVWDASDNLINMIENLANPFGYNIADLEDDMLFRVQCCEVVDDEEINKKTLLRFISELNAKFL